METTAGTLPGSASHAAGPPRTLERFARSLGHRDIILVLAVIGLSVGLPAVLAAISGNLSIPHNDSWAYSVIAEHFARTGKIALVGWNSPFLIGQFVVLGPLGRSIVAQQLLVVVLAGIAVGATFLLLRTTLSPRHAVFGTAVLGTFPGFGLLATSFMGDIPMYCAIVTTLLVGRTAINRRSFALLTVAAAIGVWGFTIRDQAIAALASIVIAAFVAWPSRAMRVRVAVLAAIIGGSIIMLEAWRQSLPHGQHKPIELVLGGRATECAQAFFTLGLFVLPAAVAVSRPSKWSAVARWSAIVTAVAGAVLVTGHSPLLGNYLDSHGAYPAVLLGRRQVFPSLAWDALELAALCGGILLAGSLVDALYKVDLEFVLFGLFTVLGTVFAAFVDQSIFDRFLLPLVPVALVVVCRGACPGALPRWRSIAAGGVLAAMFATSLAVTMNGLAFDSARWSAAQSLVRGGVSPLAIDGGLEWLGYHYAGPATSVAPSVERADLPWYAQVLFPKARECYVLTTSPRRGLGQVSATFDYRTFLAFGSSHLLVYDTRRCAM